MNVMLIGFKSCGKSTVGAALAERMGWAFVDTDTLIEQRHAAQSGEALSFRAIYREHGRDYFLDLERQVVADLERCDNYVIAAGGGTVINHALPAGLRRNATLIYLEVAPEALIARIREGGTPAFFTGEDFEAEFRRTFAARHPIYRDLADYVIAAGDRSIADLVDWISASGRLRGAHNAR